MLATRNGAKLPSASLSNIEKSLGILHSDMGSLREILGFAALGQEVQSALGGCQQLRLAYSRGRYSAHMIGGEAEGKGAAGEASSRETLLAAVASLNQREASKRCAGPCKLVKTLLSFSRDANGKDGHTRYCKICEAARVKEYTKRKPKRNVAANNRSQKAEVRGQRSEVRGQRSEVSERLLTSDL